MHVNLHKQDFLTTYLMYILIYKFDMFIILKSIKKGDMAPSENGRFISNGSRFDPDRRLKLPKPKV